MNIRWKHESLVLVKDGSFFIFREDVKMEKKLAETMETMKWGFLSCLLFMGIFSPAFHQFYGK